MKPRRKWLICCGNVYEPCGEPVLYVRHTQFSGDHPFCMHHAMKESDFLVPDSSVFWTKVEHKSPVKSS